MTQINEQVSFEVSGTDIVLRVKDKTFVLSAAEAAALISEITNAIAAKRAPVPGAAAAPAAAEPEHAEGAAAAAQG